MLLRDIERDGSITGTGCLMVDEGAGNGKLLAGVTLKLLVGVKIELGIGVNELLFCLNL